jgi:serine kinase of HPr protein (carbohydrate metabolism regulator)
MSSLLSSETVHVSCVAIGSQAVLISGPSGSGKSDLSLRLLDRGALLVSDDYTIVSRSNGLAMARAPETIRGKIEVRGVGILVRPSAEMLPISCVIDLTEPCERLPTGTKKRVIAGVELPLFGLDPFEASAPIKVELILQQLANT